MNSKRSTFFFVFCFPSERKHERQKWKEAGLAENNLMNSRIYFVFVTVQFLILANVIKYQPCVDNLRWSSKLLDKQYPQILYVFSFFLSFFSPRFLPKLFVVTGSSLEYGTCTCFVYHCCNFSSFFKPGVTLAYFSLVYTSLLCDVKLKNSGKGDFYSMIWENDGKNT